MCPRTRYQTFSIAPPAEESPLQLNAGVIQHRRKERKLWGGGAIARCACMATIADDRTASQPPPQWTMRQGSRAWRGAAA